MIPTVSAPKVQAGGLVTVAFLKARLDEGDDHLGIFMPLVLDVLSSQAVESFTTADIQDALAARHGVAMPQQTVATLLKRATKRKYLLRDAGRYRRNPSNQIPPPRVVEEKKQIEAGQLRLGEALICHAGQRGVTIESTDDALSMLFKFLEDEQIALLLGSPPAVVTGTDIPRRNRAILVEFVHDAIRDDPALLSVLRGILEGLVLYHAAFLPDLATSTRRFKDLRVVFDSGLVRQALGYEGVTMRTLMRETIDVLKAGGARCLVFDKTVHEIKRILVMYESRLSTEGGRSSLRPSPMTRHFLTQRYSPSDVFEMVALLEREIAEAGFQIIPTPPRERDYTAAEQDLAVRLADPVKKDALEPRVVHDVDCIASVLTLRKGQRSLTLDGARAVFTTDSSPLILNTRLWWEEDEHESGFEPAVHIRALSNLAWLKKPTLCTDFMVRELVALCTAALRPAQTTW